MAILVRTSHGSTATWDLGREVNKNQPPKPGLTCYIELFGQCSSPKHPAHPNSGRSHAGAAMGADVGRTRSDGSKPACVKAAPLRKHCKQGMLVRTVCLVVSTGSSHGAGRILSSLLLFSLPSSFENSRRLLPLIIITMVGTHHSGQAEAATQTEGQ